MVRYGVHENDRTQRERNRINVSTSNEDENRDEVDNVMSKYQYPEGIRIPVSSSSHDPDDSDDEHPNAPSVGSRTSPKGLSPLQNNQSSSVTNFGYQYYERRRTSASSTSHHVTDDEDESYSEDALVPPANNVRLNFNDLLFISLLAIAVSVAIACWYRFSNNNWHNQNIYDESKFYNDINYLGKKYKVNDNSILQIQTVISTTFQKQDTASFIFPYNTEHTNFNLTSFDKFINDVAFTAARFLRNNCNIQNHVIVDSTKLDMQVHSELIEKYRNDVTKTGVMLVKNLDEVPSSLAMAFHYYCDEFNPLVKRSAIFFTLNMARCSDHKISHASIEKCLAKKWTIIPKDNIVPLLTRVVSVVIDVTNVT